MITDTQAHTVTSTYTHTQAHTHTHTHTLSHTRTTHTHTHTHTHTLTYTKMWVWSNFFYKANHFYNLSYNDIIHKFFKNQKVLEHGRQCARTLQAKDVTPSGMNGNEVKEHVDKFAKFISTKYFNQLKFLSNFWPQTLTPRQRSVEYFVDNQDIVCWVIHWWCLL
jgi:hypothetical protein